MDGSRRLQQRAASLLPGGVDSPVRAFRAVGGDPPFVARAEGAYLWDVDGNRYLDLFWLLGADDPGACLSSGSGGDPRGGGAQREFWRVACRMRRTWPSW